VTRSELKSLIKECLVEIITEGSGTGPVRESAQARREQPQPKRHPALDSIVHGQRPAPQRREPPKPSPQQFNAITSDPVMASIFADTASTTLVEQVAQERGITKAADTGVDPSMFEGAGNWASLAFADSPRKNR